MKKMMMACALLVAMVSLGFGEWYPNDPTSNTQGLKVILISNERSDATYTTNVGKKMIGFRALLNGDDNQKIICFEYDGSDELSYKTVISMLISALNSGNQVFINAINSTSDQIIYCDKIVLKAN